MFESNKILVKELQKGDEKAYAYLYDVYYENLIHYCFNLTSNLPQAKDIVQNVLVKMWHNRKNIHISTSLKSYLYRAVFNEFATEYDKAKKRGKMLLQIKREVLDNIVERDYELMEEKLALLEAAIEELPAKCRKVFLLSKRQGYRYKEIATQLDISEKTVEKHISRAIGRIKQTLYANAAQLFFLLLKKIATIKA